MGELDVRGRGRILLALVAVLSLVVTATAVASPPRSPGGEPTPVIVVFDDDVASPGAGARQLVRQHDGQLSFVYEHALKGFAAVVPASAVDALARDHRVAYVEVDQQIGLFDHQEGELPSGVDRIETDQKLTLTGDAATGETIGIGVAVIDTGIQLDHPDLNVMDGTNCSGGGPFSMSCDDAHGGDDDHGHGTHVAGTIGALDNGFGVVGVAPGADLYAVKVLRKDGSGYMSWIIAGIDWVTARADTISVANMSLGCECSSGALDDAITNSTDAGVVYVVAAGNSGKNAATFSPANHPRVITVAAIADFDGMAGGAHAPTCRSDVGGDDEFATFSNYGEVVEIAAPGVCINSTWIGSGYQQASGTSMASPHGAGAAALYIVENAITSAPDRWQTVRNGLVNDWTVPANDACGYDVSTHPTNDPERLLILVMPCQIAGAEPIATGTITGAVTVAGSDPVQPIEGATVVVDGTSLEATTDVNGSYTIIDVPEGVHNVTASADGYEPLTQQATVKAEETTTLNFALSAAEPVAIGAISGKVTEADGTTAIGGATVVVDGTSLEATTDVNGNYTIDDVPEGTHNVTASADGYESATKEATVNDGETTTLVFALAAEQATVSGEVSVASIDYSTRGGRTNDRHLDVTLSVVDGNGNGVGGATVSATLSNETNSWGFTGQTDSDGTLTVSVMNAPSGCYTTTVDNVTADGLVWDGETPGNGHCK